MRALLNDIDVVVSVDYMRTLGYPGDNLLFAPYLLLLYFLKTVARRFLVDGIATFTQTSGVLIAFFSALGYHTVV
jgi:hypothetical protein